jgi:soluble lytic murein transglycosylase-like protein
MVHKREANTKVSRDNPEGFALIIAITVFFLSVFIFLGCIWALSSARKISASPEKAAVEVPAAIVEGVIRVESGGNPLAVHYNADGSIDQGLCQINNRYLFYFATLYNLPNLDPFNPKQSREFLRRHLLGLFRITGSWRLAVSAYHSGPAGACLNDAYVTRVMGEAR